VSDGEEAAREGFKALGTIVADMRWQAFADSWLAIGLAAMYLDAINNHCVGGLYYPWELGERVGRVVRRRK
jgi:hypothetical protein